MIRASVWQWDRHVQKQAYVAELSRHLQLPIVDFAELLPVSPEKVPDLIFRRARVAGSFDFDREMVLRNRRLGESPGVFVLTPLKIKDSQLVVLVNRGFVPLNFAAPEDRKQFHGETQVEFTGLIKESVPRRWLAPKDPPSGNGQPWVDAWLRADLENMSRQLPYQLLPVFVEMMGNESASGAEKQIVVSKSGRDDIFNLAGRIEGPKETRDMSGKNYPIPQFDTVIPPARHLGYVYEWAIMAVMTICIAIVLQLRRPKPASNM